MAEPTKDASAPGLGVVWQEGMLLSPQHFQQMERAHHLRLTQRFRFSEPFGWGLRSFQLDDQALLHGRFSLIRAAGVFPDGTSFDTDTGDPLPTARDISKWFDGQHDRLLVSLGLPVQRPGQPIVSASAGDSRMPPGLFVGVPCRITSIGSAACGWITRSSERWPPSRSASPARFTCIR